jgi:hypothetical protein
MKRILFVPATARNALLLKEYAIKLREKCQCFFLRTTIFGNEGDMGLVEKELEFPIITSDFLQQEYRRREWQRVLVQKRSHREYANFLVSLQLDLIVIGWDADSIGKWTAFIARDVRIPTLGCQEGGWTFTPEFPAIMRWKVFVLNCLCHLFYPLPLRYTLYQHSDYFALWGNFDRKRALQTGVAQSRLFIIGHPTADFHTQKRTHRTGFDKMLFLDVPYRTLPSGTFDGKKLSKFRKELMAIACGLRFRVIYKTHPLTKKEEVEEVRSMLAQFNNITLKCDGVAEELFDQVDICCTFPSTCIYTIFAKGLPLIQMLPTFRGYKKDGFDAVAHYNAGFTIRRPEELSDAVATIRKAGWYEKYLKASIFAAEDMVGPFDGKASDRFADAVEKIISKQK